MNGNGGPPAGVHVEKMVALRNQKAAEIVDLGNRLSAAKAELAGYDRMLAVGGIMQVPRKEASRATGKRRPKVPVKGIVMEIVDDAGKDGITTDDIIREIEKHGKSLPKDSVIRFLKRFQTEGRLAFDNGRYRIGTT